MKASDLLLKAYGECVDGQWSLICLDFSLATQASTLPEAHAILHSQIKEYLIDALHGKDREFAPTLLTRRASLKYWLKWHIENALSTLRGEASLRQTALREPMDMVPA